MREYSFILAGRVGVGKTSLFNQLQNQGLSSSGDFVSEGRRGYDDGGLQQLTMEMEIGGKDVKVILWDTGGLERYDSMTANYYRNAHAVLLVYDLGASDTLYCLNEWVTEARSNNRWSDRLVFAMLGNKKDMKEHAIEEEAIEAFGAKHGINPHVNCKVSAKDHDNVQEVFRTIIKFVDDHFTHSDMDERDATDPLPTDYADTDRLRLAFSVSYADRQKNKKCSICARR